MRTFKDHLVSRLNRIREIRQEHSFKELKPLKLIDFQESELLTQASENGASHIASPKTITSVTTIGKEDQPIFDKAAKKFMFDSFYYRSANGHHSPRRSPIKIKIKIISKPMKPIHPHRLRIWRANHRISMMKLFPRKTREKPMNEANFALMGPITRKCCSRRSIQMCLLSKYLYKQSIKKPRDYEKLPLKVKNY